MRLPFQTGVHLSKRQFWLVIGGLCLLGVGLVVLLLLVSSHRQTAIPERRTAWLDSPAMVNGAGAQLLEEEGAALLRLMLLPEQELYAPVNPFESERRALYTLDEVLMALPETDLARLQALRAQRKQRVSGIFSVLE